MATPTTTQSLLTPQVLPGGLLLRRSTSADAEKLAAFNAFIHSDNDELDQRVGVWTSDLLRGDHPTFASEDFTIVEDPSTGKIVSSLNLISQTWTYGGLAFKMGRPELVGTLPDYRRRGLVRLQFDVIHEWSRQRGELLQGITGIPYYYRQFGYEMAVDLGGGHMGASFNVPRLKEDEKEPFVIRPARDADVPFITRLFQLGSQRYLLAAQWDETLWRYELSGKSRQNVNRNEIRIIETPEGVALGVLTHPFELWGDMIAMTGYELKEGVSWYEVTPSVIRYLWQTGEALAAEGKKSLQAFGFWLGENHPAFQVAAERLVKARRRYAWYLRVPDLPAFLRHIAPVLERRLQVSPLSGYSGQIKLGFYRNGVVLKFEAGKLAAIETWQPESKDFGTAAYPGLVFYQLLFGYRTQAELEYAYPDCYSSDQLKPVLQVLFPKQPSDIWPIQ